MVGDALVAKWLVSGPVRFFGGQGTGFIGISEVTLVIGRVCHGI